MLAESAAQFPWQIMAIGAGALALVVTAFVLLPIAKRIAARRQARKEVEQNGLQCKFNWDLL